MPIFNLEEPMISARQVLHRALAGSAVAHALTESSEGKTVLAKEGIALLDTEMRFLLQRLEAVFSDIQRQLGRSTRSELSPPFINHSSDVESPICFRMSNATSHGRAKISFSTVFGNQYATIPQATADVFTQALQAELAQPCWQIFAAQERETTEKLGILSAAFTARHFNITAPAKSSSAFTAGLTLNSDTCPHTIEFYEHLAGKLEIYQAANPAIIPSIQGYAVDRTRQSSFTMPLNFNPATTDAVVTFMLNRPALLSVDNNTILDAPQDILEVIEAAKISYIADGVDITAQTRAMRWDGRGKSKSTYTPHIIVSPESKTASIVICTGSLSRELALSRLQGALKAMGAGNIDEIQLGKLPCAEESAHIRTIAPSKINAQMPFDTMRTFLTAMATEGGQNLYQHHMQGTAKTAHPAMGRLAAIMSR